MTDFFVGGKKLALRPNDAIGAGGEATIYQKGAWAYKIFKPATHPDFAGMPAAQATARARIKEHQKKLHAFPARLPPRVIVPQELVLDGEGKIAGYRMSAVEGADVLFLYCDKDYRERGVPDDQVRGILLDLAKTIEGVHGAQAVLGDFNDLNVLVKGTEAYVIDADSMQFGPYLARMFTQTFVDPLLCDRHPTDAGLVLARPYTADADWYSYLVMVMRALLFVGPYGGVYRPKDPGKRVAPDLRPLSRITIFDPEVVYPKPARHFKILPDALLDYFDRVFRKDERGVPPMPLLEELRFTTCGSCGTLHARTLCPNCVGVTPAGVTEIHTGSAHGVKVFEADGPILAAALQSGTLRFLYHEGGAFRREDGRDVVRGPLDPSVRYRISRERTVFARGGHCVVFGGLAPEQFSVDPYGLVPQVDANADAIFFAKGGALSRIGALGADFPERIGDVLERQTQFWVGPSLGFGFYRAAELSNFFVFRPLRRGLYDSVALPPIRGQLIEAWCTFAEKRIWFFTATQEAGQTIHRSYLIDESGTLIAQAGAAAGDGSWLGRIGGASAAYDFLVVPTDDGVVRVGPSGSALGVAKEYPDTHRFVDAASRLFLAREGLYAVRRHDIWRLTIGSP